MVRNLIPLYYQKKVRLLTSAVLYIQFGCVHLYYGEKHQMVQKGAGSVERDAKYLSTNPSYRKLGIGFKLKLKKS